MGSKTKASNGSSSTTQNGNNGLNSSISANLSNSNINAKQFAHEAIRQGEREKRKRVGEGASGKDFQTVDFNTISSPILRRYSRVNKLKSSKNKLTRDELVAVVSRHFSSQNPKELDVVACFLYSIHNKGSVIRLPVPLAGY